MSVTLVETITIGSGGAASATFSSIPQDAVDLQVLISVRCGTPTVASDGYIYLNGDQGKTQSSQSLRGTGSGITTSLFVADNFAMRVSMPGTSSTASTFGNASIYVSNYASTGMHKTFSIDNATENNGTAANAEIRAGIWSSNNAITSLTVANGNNLLEHSVMSLYKITAD
tara:strand:- start:354 stop:866 length:513 start_codon:yes stop_codon:yes gene_type:complete